MLMPCSLAIGQTPVEGRIRRVGLFSGTLPSIRAGEWTFADVELRYAGTSPFEGQLRVEQLDRDGDVVVSVLDIALAPGGEWRPYEVYFVSSSASNAEPVRVKLYDHQGHLAPLVKDTGESATELVSDTPTTYGADEILIVDLTQPRRLPHAASLAATSNMRAGGFANPRVVRGLSPRELPSNRLGLAAVDAIIWDDADTSMLSQQQTDALIEWVQGGGRLLITGGKNWQSLARSPLASILPVTITGSMQRDEALEFLDIVSDNEYNKVLQRNYVKNHILRCRMTPLPDAIRIPAKDEGNPQIAYRSLPGRGMLTFVGASLLELLPPPPTDKKETEEMEEAELLGPEPDSDFARICEKVIAKTFLGLPKQQEEEGGMLGYNTLNLFDTVRETINFGRLGSAFLIFAVLFALIYTSTSTAGTYIYLKRRGMEQHCWSVFAIASAVGIVIGTGMVWTLRGFSTKLWQTTVVDTKAGENQAYAGCLFGVKTPDHSQLDLRLPLGKQVDAGVPELGTLSGIPSSTSTELVESKFVAPESYECMRTGGELKSVPIRATLKEFRGSWRGSLSGTVEAKLVLDAEGRFGPGSYIRNRLGVALENCYILEATQEIAGGGPSDLTQCYFLGSLPVHRDGEEIGGEQLHQLLYYDKPKDSTETPKLKARADLLLSKSLKNWKAQLPWGAFSGGTIQTQALATFSTEQAYYSMLVLSVFDLVQEDKSNRQLMRRSHGRAWNCTQQITKNTAMLIGFCEQPAPAVLEANLTSLQPEKARTMYRIVIPVDRSAYR